MGSNFLGMDVSWGGVRKSLGGMKKSMAKNLNGGSKPSAQKRKASKVKKRRLY